MKCLRCIEENKTSKVYDLGGTVTLMIVQSYWDEKGTKHVHDPNLRHNSYRCSNGHKFFAKYKLPCPAPGCENNEDFKIELIQDEP